MARLLAAAGSAPVAGEVALARSFWSRLVGLLGRAGLAPQAGLVFERCRAVHTVGMRFPIDVVFVDRAWRIVHLRSQVPPGRLVGPVRKAWGVVELAPGTISRTGLWEGDQLRLEEAGVGCRAT